MSEGAQYYPYTSYQLPTLTTRELHQPPMAAYSAQFPLSHSVRADPRFQISEDSVPLQVIPHLEKYQMKSSSNKSASVSNQSPSYRETAVESQQTLDHHVQPQHEQDITMDDTPQSPQIHKDEDISQSSKREFLTQNTAVSKHGSADTPGSHTTANFSQNTKKSSLKGKNSAAKSQRSSTDSPKRGSHFEVAGQESNIAFHKSENLRKKLLQHESNATSSSWLEGADLGQMKMPSSTPRHNQEDQAAFSSIISQYRSPDNTEESSPMMNIRSSSPVNPHDEFDKQWPWMTN